MGELCDHVRDLILRPVVPAIGADTVEVLADRADIGTASTNYAPTTSGLDMSSDEHDVTSSIYLAVLPNNIASPLAPESDEEGAPRPAADGGRGGRGGNGGAGAAAALPETPPKPVRIDFDKLQQRIVALPFPPRAYTGLDAGRPGVLFVLEPASGGGGGRGGAFGGGAGSTLTRFDLKTRKSEKFADGVVSFNLSANGEKVLLRMGVPGAAGGRGAPGAVPPVPTYVIAATATPLKPGEGALKLANLEVNVDPIAEWKQMYHEVWRIQRSYFYDPNLHGVNTADSEKEYEKYLDSLSSRADLNYIFKDMLSEITSGHLRGGGGNIPLAKTIPGGLLGADYEIANGRYRFKKIYVGESWNPQLQSPLAQPGLNVNEGDYLLAVNGQDLAGKDDVSRLLENTAGKPVLLKIAQCARRRCIRGQRARNHRGADCQRIAAAPCGMDRGQPAQSGSTFRR